MRIRAACVTLADRFGTAEALTAIEAGGSRTVPGRLPGAVGHFETQSMCRTLVAGENCFSRSGNFPRAGTRRTHLGHRSTAKAKASPKFAPISWRRLNAISAVQSAHGGYASFSCAKRSWPLRLPRDLSGRELGRWQGHGFAALIRT